MENKRKYTAGGVFAALGKALCYLLLFLVCQTLVSGAYTAAAVVVIMGQDGLTGDLFAMTEQLMELVMKYAGEISLISNLLAILVLVVFFLVRRKNPLREAGLVKPKQACAWAAPLLAPGLYALVTTVLSLLPQEWMEDYAEASAALNDKSLMVVLATVVAAPIVEEVIFRGLVQSRLQRGLPAVPALVLAALAFGLCHGQAVWVAYAFVMGLVFGMMALRSGSVWPSLLTHFVFNAIGQLMVYLPPEWAESWTPIFIMAGVTVVFYPLALLLLLRRRKTL